MRVPTSQLDYLNDAPSRRQRRLAWATYFAIALASSLGLWQFGPRIIGRIDFLWVRWRSMNYTAPADRVVFANDPSTVARLRDNNRYTHDSAFKTAFIDQTYEEFAKFGDAGAYEPIVFLHDRQNAYGQHRLIAVTIGPALFSLGRLALESECFQNVVGFRSTPMRCFDGGLDVGYQSLVVYAGQPDPRDASHFTIKILENNAERIIDGWLDDDDSIVLQPRDPSTKPLQPR